MLERRDLRLVEAVARLGSLTRSARELHVTPSALSHQLADLEGRIGLPLFSRAGKRMVPTPAGERLRDRAPDLLAGLSRAVDDARAAGARRREVVRLSTECYTCYHWLPAVLRQFERDFPLGDVRIVAEATRRPIPALLAGKLDVAVISSPVRDRRIITAPLFEDELVAITAKDHPWARRPWVDAVDFAAERLVTIMHPYREAVLFRVVLEPAGITPKDVLEVQLTEATIELVKAGIGVAVMARWTAAPHVAAGTLGAVPVTSRGLHRAWSAAALRHRARTPAVSAFLKALERWSGDAVSLQETPNGRRPATQPRRARRRTGRARAR